MVNGYGITSLRKKSEKTIKLNLKFWNRDVFENVKQTKENIIRRLR